MEVKRNLDKKKAGEPEQKTTKPKKAIHGPVPEKAQGKGDQISGEGDKGGFPSFKRKNRENNRSPGQS